MNEIELLNAAGERLGAGPLETATGLQRLTSLDKIGQVTFSFPAADPRGQYVTSGSRFRIKTWANGRAEDLGNFIFRAERVTYGPQKTPMRQVTAYDALQELSFRTVALRRNYVYQPVDSVIDDLVSMVPGWLAAADTGIGNTTISYEGESVLIAIDALRDRWGMHYRLGRPSSGNNVLEFGAFGVVSGVRLIQPGAASADINDDPSAAFIDSLEFVEESADVKNCIIPLGAGQGTAQLTIETASLGDYAILTGTNADGSTYWYLKDQASVDAYGERWQILNMTGIRPITNSDANIQNAADALKLAAERYLRQHKEPLVTYRAQVSGLRRTVQPGDTVRLTYRGIAGGTVHRFVDVDGDFYVMDINRSFGSGAVPASLTIATVDRRRTSDSDLMINVLSDIKALKMHVQPNLARPTVGPYTRDIDPDTDAEFKVSLGDETLALNYARLKFRTAPFVSNIQGAASGGSSNQTSSSGGGSTPTSAGGGDHRHKMFDHHSAASLPSTWQRYICRTTLDGSGWTNNIVLGVGFATDLFTEDSSGDHTHTISIPAHTHSINIPAHTHDLVYGIYKDAVHPQTISLEINGTDRTTELGGPWAASNSPVDVEVDITDILVADGIRRDHTIKFTCGDGQGEIEFEVIILATIQAIAVT